MSNLLMSNLLTKQKVILLAPNMKTEGFDKYESRTDMLI